LELILGFIHYKDDTSYNYTVSQKTIHYNSVHAK